MKKCELLSPAGNMEMLKYAVCYGADAVYLAGTRFGARKFAGNFDESEMMETVKYAHLYGVKVYVTINTLIYEDEVEDFIEYVKFIHEIGVDAVLVQDFGMLSLIHKIAPNLELHASTQMHNNGKDILELLTKYGVKRAVLDREMSIDEIKKLPKTIEIEVFCHGALCVSYSGRCLFSSRVLNRSGNRGECAGMCRLPFKTESDKIPRYYLSLKDLCSINYLDKLIDLGVDSLKIEGRMKSPEYVGYITKVYRSIIDSYYEGKMRKATDEEMRNIKILFNRGFTEGFLNNTPNDLMANTESPNHIGIHLGRYSLQNKKVKLVLDEDLYQGDTIRFKEDSKGMTVNFLYNKNDKLINKGCKGETVYIDNFLELEKFGELRLVGSINLNKELHYLPNRKVEITGVVSLKLGERIKLTVTDGVNEICKEGVLTEKAIKSSLSTEDVQKQINKTGSSIYILSKLDVILDDGVFVNVKELNTLRRETLEALDEIRKNSKKEVIFKDYEPEPCENMDIEPKIKVVVQNKEQYDIAKEYTDDIFTSNRDLLELEGINIYPKYDDKIDESDASKYIIGDLGSLLKIKDGDEVGTDYLLNVTNSYTVREMARYKVQSICLSCELDDEKIFEIASKVSPSRLELFIYGRVELMKMKYSPLNNSIEKSLIDRNGKTYPIKKTGGFNILMSYDRMDKLEEIEKYMRVGIRSFRLDFYDETRDESEKILKRLSDLLRKNS